VKRYIAALLVVGAITRLVNVTEANVVYLDYDFWGPDKTYEWNFDDDLQQLTVTESIFEFGPDYLWSIKIGGKVDSDTTFSVVRTITNNTRVTWTELEMFSGPSAIAGAFPVIVPESVESEKLQAITYSNYPGDRPRFKFAAPPSVLDGESFEMRFDISVSYIENYWGGFHGVWDQTIIPEPATLSFFALGAVILVRRRRAQKP